MGVRLTDEARKRILEKRKKYSQMSAGDAIAAHTEELKKKKGKSEWTFIESK